MRRLNQAALSQLPANVAVPSYDRQDLVPGIVHIGIGAFHRGHMATYVDRILAQDNGWGIIGVSLRRPDTKTALEPQDYLYTVQEKGGAGMRHSVIGSIIDIIDASTDNSALLAALAAPATRIVSLTVTEKGYCHDPATGRLSLSHPDIAHDLEHPEKARSVPGLLCKGLAERRAVGLGGFTVLSCDNVQGNGHVARDVVLAFAEQTDPELAGWIGEHVTFPSTMVDRIVPATSDEDRDLVTSSIGFFDAWPISTEPFSQWVIEDDFVAGRPPLQDAGAQFVADVAPFELMKLRMLNGAHSAIAYLGALSGHTYVAEVVGNPNFRNFLRRQSQDEVIPTLHIPDTDLVRYGDGLLERFQNPSLHHRCLQIAADGSQKIPIRILAPIRERMADGRPVSCLTLTLAAWMAYIDRCVRKDSQSLVDPLAKRLIEAASGAETAEELVARLFDITEIFGTDLRESADLKRDVAQHLSSIWDLGAEGAVKALLHGSAAVRQA
jgi:fructuronate reductase